MAIAHVKDTGVDYTLTTSSTSHACTVSSTGGNALFLILMQGLSAGGVQSLSSVTDSASNTWTLVAGDGNTNGRADGAYCLNATAVSSVTPHYTANGSGTTQATLTVSEFSGVPATAILDGSAAAHYGTNTTPLTITATTANPADVVIAAAAPQDNPWTSLTYTDGGGASTNFTKSVGYAITSSAGSQSCTFSGLPAGHNVTGSLIFAVGVAAVTLPPPVNLGQAVRRSSLW